jgi:hypothetical protein
MRSTGTSARIVALGLILGVVATALMYGANAPYLGFAIYILMLLGALFFYARVEHVHPVRRNIWLLIPILFYTVMLVIRADEMLAMLNIVAGTSATLLLVYFFANGNVARQEIIDYPIKALISSVAIWFQPLNEIIQTSKWFRERQGHLGNIAPFVRGAAITLPVITVFVILLSAADEVFADLVHRVLSVFSLQNADNLIGQGIFTGFFGWIAIGGLTFALLPRKAKRMPTESRQPDAKATDPKTAADPVDDDYPTIEELTAKPTVSSFGLGFTETTMLLSSVCVLFGTFVGIQFVYLFGGQRNIDIRKFSYADYVHRGFAELVIVAVLTLGLAYILNAIGKHSSRRQLNISRGMMTVLMLLTSVILMSSFQRLRLYEQAYGYTTLRLTIYIFIGWLGVLFAGFTLSLYWLPESINVFSVTMLVAVFGFAATLDIINPDAFVASQIVQSGNLDPLYLSTLSDEAVPILTSLADSPEPGTRQIISAMLANRHDALLLEQKQADWREFNLGKRNAYTALGAVKDKLNGPRLTFNAEHQLDEFKHLKQGMSYREIIRQFGYPYSSNDWSYRTDPSERDTLYVSYRIEGDQIVQLAIDTVDGLSSICAGTSDALCARTISLER